MNDDNGLEERAAQNVETVMANLEHLLGRKPETGEMIKKALVAEAFTVAQRTILQLVERADAEELYPVDR